MKITVTKRVGGTEKTLSVEDDWKTAVTPEDVRNFSMVMLREPYEGGITGDEKLHSIVNPYCSVSKTFFDWMKRFVLNDDIRCQLKPEEKKEIDDCIREIEPDFRCEY